MCQHRTFLTNGMARTFKRMRMSRRSYRARRSSRRFVRRSRRRRGRRGTRIGRSPGFPKIMKFVHKYVDSGFLGVGPTMLHKQFNALGMYDPDPSLGGHQPLFFDQVGLIYDHYTVIGSSIKWTFTPEGGGDFNPVRVIVWHNDDTSTTYSDMNNIQEAKGSKARSMTFGSSSRSLTVRQRYSAKKTFGGSVVGNPNLQGSTSGNPPEGHFFQASFQQLDASGVNPITDVRWIVEITYIAVWRELHEVLSS